MNVSLQYFLVKIRKHREHVIEKYLQNRIFPAEPRLVSYFVSPQKFSVFNTGSLFALGFLLQTLVDRSGELINGKVRQPQSATALNLKLES